MAIKFFVQFARCSFLLLCALRTASGCDLSSREKELILHYQAWWDYWRWPEYSELQNQKLKVFRDKSSVVVYVVPLRKVFTLFRDHTSASTCPDPEHWLECLTSHRPSTQALSITDALLGKVAEKQPIPHTEVCDVTLRVPASARVWHPSLPGDRKSQLLKCISSETVHLARNFGAVQRIVCNNFHVDDPEISVLADIVDKTGRESQLLIGVRVDGWEPLQCIAANGRHPEPGDELLIHKIQQDPVRVPVRYKEEKSLRRGPRR